MRVSCNWLAERLPALGRIDDLPALLTALGLEVDHQATPAAVPAGVVAGLILAKKRIAGTKLYRCRVDAGARGELDVVCGAPNVRARLRAALALPGTVLGGKEVAARSFGAVSSQGMLCSEAELGLGEEAATIMELGRAAAPGTPVAELLECDDRLLELELTPNRGDWLSMLGVARELAAKTGAKYLRPRLLKLPAARRDRSLGQAATIDPAAAAACPRFTCMPLAGVDTSRPTPPLIAERLRRCGQRPVSVIVDITNYVMLELGQPLHAFDAAKLDGAIEVRFARAGERLVLLDGTEATLGPRHLVVADQSRAEALAGVMGGLDSAVTAATTSIVLEAAHFTPATIRGRTREFKLNSEAAHRFERGVDPALCEIALSYAAALILRHCGGRAGLATLAGAPPPPPAPISFDPASVAKLTGVEASAQQARRSLKALGCKVGGGRKALKVVAPSWRFDLENPADLVEEIVRLAGYDAVPTTMPRQTSAFVAVSERLVTPALARDRLVALGFNEVVTYSFVAAAGERDYYANADPLRLSNPLTAELQVMRSGLLPGLIAAANYNAHRRQEQLRLFELGRCFNSAADQPLRLGGLCWGPLDPDHWDDPGRSQDCFDVTGIVAMLLPGAALELVPDARQPALHPGRSARLMLAGAEVGVAGELHPQLLERGHCELEPAPAVFELDFARLATLAHGRAARPLSKLPLVRRDLALVVASDVTAAQLLKSARSLAVEEMRAVEIFDSFVGAKLGAGRRGIGLRLTLQGSTTNLVEERIRQITEAVAAKLAADHQAQLRS